MLGVTTCQDSCEIGQPNYEGVTGGKLGNLLPNRSISHEIYLALEPETRRRFQLCEGGEAGVLVSAGQRIKADYPPG